MTILDRGVRTPPGRLVFVPVDGRPRPWLSDDFLRTIPADVIGRIGRANLTRAAWILVPCLVELRAEFNRLAPDRDTASDGSIGDTAHAASSSDHNPDETGATPYEDSDSVNEVHAIDVDASGPWPDGLTFQQIVDVVVANHRSGRDDRLQNIIYNKRIISRSWNWDSWHAYTGTNPHTAHGHFSARYTTAQESDTSPWGVEGLTDMTEAELLAALKKKTFQDAIYNAVNQDRVPRYDQNGVAIPPDPNDPGAHTMTWESALRYVGLDAVLIKKQLAALAASVTALTAGEAADADRDRATAAAVNERAAELIKAIEETRLGNAEQSAEQIAAALRTLLGDRAAEVGAILAQDSDPA